MIRRWSTAELSTLHRNRSVSSHVAVLQMDRGYWTLIKLGRATLPVIELHRLIRELREHGATLPTARWDRAKARHHAIWDKVSIIIEGVHPTGAEQMEMALGVL